jgi:flagellin
MNTPLLEVKNLSVHFPVRSGLLQRPTGVVKALDDVSLKIDQGTTLGLVGESVATKVGAQTSLASLDDALMRVNSVRADLGAMQNRLQSTINSLAISDENLSAANSRIRDADLALEVSDMTKNNILMQAGISVLGQANAQSQSALKLLS